MLSRFLRSAHLARFFVTPAKPALSNVVTRSFMVSSRVASAEAAEPKTTEKKTKTKAKSTKTRTGPSRPKKTEIPKKIVITDDMKPPKPVSSPYMIFSQEYSSKLPKLGSAQEACARAKECGAAWQALSSSEKEQYSEAFHRRHEEYMQKKEEWFKNVDPEVLKVLNTKRIANGKRRLVKLHKSSGKPLNAYTRFLLALRQEQNLSLIDASRAASMAWKSLPEEEKKQHVDRHKQEMDEWRKHKMVAGELEA